MKIIAALSAGLAVVLMSVTGGVSRADDVPAGPDTPLVGPWVHASGTGFVDQNGNAVYLRGFNAAANWSWKKAAGLGANFVRIPIYWNDLEPTPPVGSVHAWDASVLAALDAEVQALQSQKVNVLLDLHQTGWSPYFSRLGRHPAQGMPSWLYSPAYFPQPVTQDGLGQARLEFATKPAILSYYKAYLELIVKRYRSYPNVVGYEVFNEPQPGKLKPTHEGTQALIAFQGKLLNIVRGLDPLRTVFLYTRQGGDNGFLNADLTAWGSLQNIAIEVHDYFNGLDPPYGYSADTEKWLPSHRETITDSEITYVGTKANQLRVLDQLLAKTNQWGIPLVVGEWGARANDSGLLEYQRQMLDAFRLRKLSWARWSLTSHGDKALLDSHSKPTPAALQIQQDLQKPY